MKRMLFISGIIGLFVAQLSAIFFQPLPTKPKLVISVPKPVTKPASVSSKLHLERVSFAELPGWGSVDTQQSLAAFKISCRAFLRQPAEKKVGSQFISLTVSDWRPACQAATQVDVKDSAQVKRFFQIWFAPVQFQQKQPVKGLFTGYYMPLLAGSLTKTAHYTVPLYGVPKNLVSLNIHDFSRELKSRRLIGRVKGKKVIPYYTRAQINEGAIQPVAPVIAWLNNNIDRLILETEGSGFVKLPNGKRLAIGYAGENGAPYTSIARLLIDRGLFTSDNASMTSIRKYMKAHPHRMKEILNHNRSFVFFHKLADNHAIGSQNVPLTDGYSLAIDRKWVPMGTPVWLVTTHPKHKKSAQKPFKRLMIAQDTGGAIRGPVRGDIYWGGSEEAISIAKRMRNEGRYWLLLPKHIAAKLT